MAPGLVAQTGPLQAAWQAFARNDLATAQSLFEGLTAASTSEAAEAHLGLSIIASSRGQEGPTMEHFYAFREKASRPEPMLEALWQTEGPHMSQRHLAYLEQLFAEAQSSRLRVYAAEELGAYYWTHKRQKKALTYYDAIGAIETWQLLGEFENISQSGFDLDVGAVAHPEPEHAFTNKRGVTVNWFDLKAPYRSRWVNYGYHFYTENALIYAQTYCIAPEARDVTVRIGVSGSVKVWINDQLQFVEPEERDNYADTYVFRTRLAAGPNRIVVQTGCSETEGCNMMVRLTDPNGRLFNDLTYTTEYQPYPRDYQATPQRVADPVVAFLEEEIELAAEPLPFYIALTQYYIRQDMSYEAQQVLKMAKARYPDCTYINFQLVMVSAQMDNEQDLSAYREEVKAKDPGSVLGLNLFYKEAINLKQYDEAERIISRLEVAEVDRLNLMRKRIQIASEREEVETLVRLVQAAASEFPAQAEFVRMRYFIEKDLRKNGSEARRILERYLRLYEDEEIILLLASHAFENNETGTGLALYEQLLDNNPIATGYYSRLASFRYAMGQYHEAERLMQECTRIAPYVGSYYKTLAGAYREMRRLPEAREAYEKAIYYDPFDYESRDQLRQMKGQSGVFDVFDEPDPEAIYREAPSAEAYPEDHSILLLNELQKIVHEGGAVESRRILIVKVFNAEGVDAWKEYRVTLAGNQKGYIEKAEVLKQNGARIEAQNQGGYLVFPNLEPGDAIHLRYRAQDYYFGRLIGHFYDQHYFSLYLPMQVSRYQLLVPKDKEFAYTLSNSDLEPRIEDRDTQRLYVWEAEDIAAVDYEPYMPELVDVEQVLHVSSFPSWSFIASWYAGLARAKAKPDFLVEETAQALFAGMEEATDQEVVQRIYDYIVDQIRYRSVPFLQSGLIPQKASHVITSKQGDCKDVSTLFVALAQQRGIDANLVLVNTRNNGQFGMPLPNIGFNHCIVKVNLDDTPYYVELTADDLPFAAASQALYGAQALEIPQEPQTEVSAQLLMPPNWVPNEVARRARITFEGETIVVEKESRKTGIMAARMRDIYENAGEQTRNKEMQEAISSEYPEVKLRSLTFTDDLYTNGPAVTYQYSYSAPNVFMNIGGMSIVRLPWADAIQATEIGYVASDDRQYPLELHNVFPARREEEVLIIQLPPGRALAEPPQDVTHTHPAAHYTLTFAYDEATQQLTATRTFVVQQDVVSPGDYASFKAFINQVVRADETPLALR